MEEIGNWKIGVLGLGVSGRSAANFLAARGAHVCAFDERGADAIDDLASLDPRVDRALGEPFPDMGDFDLVVPSPGIPPQRYRDRSARVWGDIELAYRAIAAPIIAVTGTNGKSTTVLLIEAMLRAAGARARAVGNLGSPALELVGERLDFAILEVSSFQLETTESFRPDVGVLLNISPDHLDRHGNFEAYAKAKDRLFVNQRETDSAIFNLDDPIVAARTSTTRGRVIGFRVSGAVDRGAFLDTGAVVLCDPPAAPTRITLDGMRLAGHHNRENVVAAFAAVAAAGVDPVAASSALATFSGLAHRCEFVAEIDGVRYVNDSKATNPGAAMSSVASFTENLVWIAGGRDKGLGFAELVDAAVGRVRAVFLIGEATEKLRAALANRVEVSGAESIEDAVTRAAKIARPGDVVLLSPACASHDQFRSFEERGERFKSAVASLRGRGGGR